MQKTILIPTDFSIESLMLLKHAVAEDQDNKVNILLMYSVYPPDSITDLLFYSPSKLVESLITKDFKSAISVLQNKYSSKILNISTEVFHGLNNEAFNNFASGNKVSEAFIPRHYKFRQNNNTFDPIPFIRASNLPVYEIDWKEKNNIPEKDQLAELFAD